MGAQRSEPDRWPGWMKRKEAAAYLGVSLSTIQRLEETEQINARRVGRDVRISKSSLDVYMESRPSAKESRRNLKPVGIGK